MCDSRPPDKKEETALRDGARHTAGLTGTYLAYEEKPEDKRKQGWGWHSPLIPFPGFIGQEEETNS